MLRTRVITAAVLLAVLLPALFLLPAAGWTVFTFAIAMVALWEWTRIAPLPDGAGRAFLALSLAVGAALCYSLVTRPASALVDCASWITQTGFVLAALFWFLVAPWWLRYRWRPRQPVVLAVSGWIVVFPTWLALVVHRQTGPWFLLALMAVIWVADICAYFAGKRFGRHKLAPQISPGKTWEGVAGALAGVVVYAWVCVWLIAHLEGPALAVPVAAMLPAYALMFVLLAGLSIVGDLFESWMKRGSGHKDSSNLLPGHGGVLDRIDALTSTLPVAALLGPPMQELIAYLGRAAR